MQSLRATGKVGSTALGRGSRGLAWRGRVGNSVTLNAEEEQFLREHRCHDVGAVLKRWKVVARSAELSMETLAEQGGYPVVGLSGGRGAGDGLYFSAGIHGDEPAGVVGLLQWAERNLEYLRSQNVVILPCLNPWGLARNSRSDANGRDLNRSFGDAGVSPVKEWLEFVEGREFRVAVMLHEDYDAQGAYLYELTRRGSRDGERLLAGVDPVIGRQEGTADGRRLEGGVLRRTRGIREIAEDIDGMPEAIHLYMNHARIALTFETPSEFSIFRRVEAQMRFLDGVAGMVCGA